MKSLRGSVKNYPWGSLTAIPNLLGREPDGRPQAELWLGAHASSSSEVDGRSLRERIAHDPVGMLGESAVEAYGACMPYLLKVLAAQRPLSLQAHPSRTRAQQGHARENAAGVALGDPARLYQDDWPKPELLCALTDFEALCGFRDPRATYALIAGLGAEAVLPLVAPLEHGGQGALRTVVNRLLRTAPDPPVMAELIAAARSVQADPEVGRLAKTIIELDAAYPADPGVLAATLLNRVTLRPGEAIFLPAGNLHAYLQGTGIEIMANSDNVLRGGLTGKHVDVDELVEVLDFTSGPTPLVVAVEQGPGVWRYPTSAPEFALWRVELHEVAQSLPATDAGRILLVTEGEAVVRHPGGPNGSDHTLRRGEAAFAHPGEALEVGGAGTLFLAAPGL